MKLETLERIMKEVRREAANNRERIAQLEWRLECLIKVVEEHGHAD